MSVYNTLTPVVLEPASQAFVEATAEPPFLYEPTPEEARAAAVVVGARRLSGLSRLVLGSVSSGLVHHAARPVLVVPESPRHAPQPDVTARGPVRSRSL
jgi:nucleotide-binding universal stress UspA family protein